jgi:hypothetical protein
MLGQHMQSLHRIRRKIVHPDRKSFQESVRRTPKVNADFVYLVSPTARADVARMTAFRIGTYAFSEAGLIPENL